MKSVWIGMSLLTGEATSCRMQSEASPLCLSLARSAFDRHDKDTRDDALNYEEFIEWARSNREFMLQVEQFRLLSEKAIGFEEEMSLPDGSDVDSDLDQELEWARAQLPVKSCASGETRSLDQALPAPWLIEPSHGYKRSAATPSSGPQFDFPPPVNLSLEWIYGAHGATTRNSCRYLCNGNIVYIVSKFAIVYCPARHQQQFYQGHRNAIMCMDVSASGEVVATGSGPGHHRPEIHVWNGLTMQCLAVLQNFHFEGVALVAFPSPASAASSSMNSTSNNAVAAPFTSVNSNLIKKKTAHREFLIASIGSDANGSMALWNWQQACVLASGRAHPTEGKRATAMVLNEDGDEVLVCGMHFILFHQLEGRFFKHKKPLEMESRLRTVPICLSAAFNGPQHAVVGTSQGQLLQFHKMKLMKVVQAHGTQQSINVCFISCRSMVLFTSGKDGQIRQWDSTLRSIGNAIDLHVELLQQQVTTANDCETIHGDDLRVCSLAYDDTRRRYVIGTRMGHIVEFMEDYVPPPASGHPPPHAAQWRIVASGHTGHAVSSIGLTNSSVQFASCSEGDRCVKLWGLRKRTSLRKIQLLFPPSVVMFSHDRALLAVGGADGSILLLEGATYGTVTQIKNTTARVCGLRFSPQDTLLAVACGNGLIYLYTLEANRRLSRFALLRPSSTSERAASLPADSLDFSIDGNFLKSQHGSADLRFWDLRRRACTRVTAMAAVRNVIWQTFTSTIGWHVSGLKSRQSPARVELVAANTSQNLAMIMDAVGQLSITHFPCIQTERGTQTEICLEKSIGRAHLASNGVDSGHVSGGFALHDSILLTSSGHDGVICQWRLEKETIDVQPRGKCVYNELMTERLRVFGLEDVYFGWKTGPMSTFTARKPLKNGIMIPTLVDGGIVKQISQRSTEAPDLDLSLSYVYGFNYKRNGLNQVLASAGAGSLLYAAGTLLVLFHLHHRVQTRVFQSGITHTVTHVIKHPSQPFVAVGSREDNALVIWNIDTQQKVVTIQGLPGAMLICAAFDDPAMALPTTASNSTPSNGENDIAAVVWKERSLNVHSLVFYDWKKAHSIVRVDMTSFPVLFGFFEHTTVGVPQCTTGFVSGGVDHVTFWSLNTATGHVQSKQGVFGRQALVQSVVCGVPVRPYVLTGTADGSVILWENGVAAYSYAAVEKSVSSDQNAMVSLVHIPSTQQVVGAMQSGQLVFWKYQPVHATKRRQPHDFLSLLTTVALLEGPWMTVLNRGEMPVSSSNRLSRNYDSDSSVLSLILLEAMNGLLVVLKTGEVFHVDHGVLLMDNDDGQRTVSLTMKDSVRLVFDAAYETHDVALHPCDGSLFAIGDARGRICVRNLQTNALVYEHHTTDHEGVRALAWNSKGDRLAVSLDKGSVLIFKISISETWPVVTKFMCGSCGITESGINGTPNDENQVLRKWCCKIKYSPADSSCERLALACRDFKIYVYVCKRGNDTSGEGQTSESFVLEHVCVGHSGRITSLDFSRDGNWLQSATSSLDLQIIRWALGRQSSSNDSETSQQSAVTGTSVCSLREDEWSSWTNTFAGPVAGLSEIYESRITVLDRINEDLLTMSGKSDAQSRWTSLLPTIALGTENGEILLHWYPMTCGESHRSLSKEYTGYFPCDSIVSHAAFCVTNMFLVTCARNADDETIILVWKTDYEDELRQVIRYAGVARNTAPSLEADETEVQRRHVESSLLVDQLMANDNANSEGDMFMASKPWLGAVREPTSAQDMVVQDHQSVESTLALDFVYGLNVGAGVMYADDSWEIVYAAASCGIVLNTKTKSQLFNQAHQGNLISALAVHERSDLVATGECGVRIAPQIVLWDVNSGSTITQITTVHRRGIALLRFTPNGDCLASIGMEDDHVMTLYSLRSHDGLQQRMTIKPLASVKTSKQVVWGLCLNDNKELVTCGSKHILFWQQQAAAAGRKDVGDNGGSGATAGYTLGMKKGLLSSHKKCNANAIVLAAAFVSKQQHVVSSQSDGSLYLWKGRTCMDVREHAHGNAPVHALWVDPAHQLVYSGGNDGRICIWNHLLEAVRSIALLDLAGSKMAISLRSVAIQSVCVRDNRVLFSTDGGEIGEIIDRTAVATAHEQSTVEYQLLVHGQAHCRGEAWGLDVHPAKIQFVTTGDDGSIRLWDAPTRSLLAVHDWASDGKPRAVAFSNDGNHIVVGTSDGKLRVLTGALENVVTTWKCSSKAVQVVKFSPDGRILAIGGHDSTLHVYDAHTYKKLGECRGHSSTITHMDFSKDSCVLQSTSTAGELLFWDVSKVNASKLIPCPSAVRDVVWASWTCPFGWPVQGIWPLGSDGSDINAVCRSQDSSVVVTGDDDGLIKLFAYPCTSSAPEIPAQTSLGHASHVTNCMFTRKDLFLITTGGLDKSVFQFRVVHNPRRAPTAS